MATKNNPGKFHCYAHAKPDEEMFILLGRDRHAPEVVRYWVALRSGIPAVGYCSNISLEKRKSLPEKLQEALAVADRMESDRGTKAVGDVRPLDIQVGGGHYKNLKIQPVEFIHANNIGFCEGSAIKYLVRWREKGGVEDLKKARHFIDLLLQLEGAKS